MGFEEMPTNAYVESSFWNFDALFQPQQHPARDAHDTFFLTRPSPLLMPVLMLAMQFCKVTHMLTQHACFCRASRDSHLTGAARLFGQGTNNTRERRLRLNWVRSWTRFRIHMLTVAVTGDMTFAALLAAVCRYGSYWRTSEAEKNLLRTHTTAVSSRMLYRLAQEVQKSGTFRPAKFFSIDRVFRNEAIDKTHLAEFPPDRRRAHAGLLLRCGHQRC